MAKKITAYPSWLGISEDRTAFVFLPDRAEIVRDIFNASISGLGGFTIANRLNAKKVPSFGPSPKWDQSTIHNLLRNRATVGEYQPKRYSGGKRVPEGHPIGGYYPPVIGEELFKAAQVARQNNLVSGRGRKGRLFTNLFRGMMSCAYCAGPVLFKSKSNVKSVICKTVIENSGCYRIAWSYQDFEAAVLEVVRNSSTNANVVQHGSATVAERIKDVQVPLDADHLYDARVALSAALRDIISELKVGSAGRSPSASKPDARVRLDRPGRYLEIRFRGECASAVSNL